MTHSPRRPLRAVKANSATKHTPQRLADCLMAPLDSAAKGLFWRDPKKATSECFGLSLRPARNLGDRRASGGWCDGLSFTKCGVILYAPTPLSRRENFTIAHELGHHLLDANDDDDFWDWLGDHPNPGHFKEETCDAIASRLLLPRDRLSTMLIGRRPGGTDILKLYRNFQASREACAIAIAERIGCDGFVLLAKADASKVTFASRLGEFRPSPWRDDPIPQTHSLRSLQAGSTQVHESWWPKGNGERVRYYQNAVRDEGDWIYAVFAVNDLWNAAKLHLPASEPTPIKRFQIVCSCGYQRSTTEFPCPKCHKAPCPKCGCDCDRRARLPTGTCDSCLMIVRNHLLVEGLCDGCR